jgi:hypothetical protein
MHVLAARLSAWTSDNHAPGWLPSQTGTRALKGEHDTCDCCLHSF